MTYHRFVDRENQGWHPTAGSDGDVVYEADLRDDLDPLAYEELDAQRGPLRPVELITDEDEARLREAFDLAGRKTVATLASALETVFHQHREHAGGMNRSHDSFQYAKRSMIAGRGGSWESDVLFRVILFGNGLNLAKPSKELPEGDVAARRAAGPGKRVHPEAHRMLVKLFQHWTSNPARYTEVAETLASVVSRYADERYGADGWNQIADQWLRPGSLAREDFHNCYHLLYSGSQHFDPALL